MISSINNSVSALRAYSTQTGVGANNVANALTDEFKSSRAVNVEASAGGGVGSVISQDKRPGPLVPDPLKNDGSFTEMSNTDIAREMVGQMTAQHGFDANARVIRSMDDTLGTVIDLIE